MFLLNIHLNDGMGFGGGSAEWSDLPYRYQNSIFVGGLFESRNGGQKKSERIGLSDEQSLIDLSSSGTFFSFLFMVYINSHFPKFILR